MYKYDINLTYHEKDNDTIYRKEILNFFNLKQFDESIIVKHIEQTYHKFKNNTQIQNIIKNIKNNDKFKQFQLFGNTNDITYFLLLFSFDYFFLIHKCLQDLNKDNKISEKNYDNMCNNLKK